MDSNLSRKNIYLSRAQENKIREQRDFVEEQSRHPLCFHVCVREFEYHFYLVTDEWSTNELSNGKKEKKNLRTADFHFIR